MGKHSVHGFDSDYDCISIAADSACCVHQAVKRQQVQIDIIPEDGEGNIDVHALERMLANGAQAPALIAITHIPTSSGR